MNITPAFDGSSLPLARFLGITIRTADQVCVVAEMTVRDDLCTLGRRVHGGALMALADTAAATGTAVNLPAGSAGATTMESKTNFLSGAETGTKLVATAVPLHRGRTTHVWQTHIETESGRLVAVVSQTQRIFYPRTT